MDNKKLVLVTTKEMAEILIIHENTLFNWAKEGMPRYKLGSNAVRYDADEVLKWVRTRGEEANNEVRDAEAKCEQDDKSTDDN